MKIGKNNLIILTLCISNFNLLALEYTAIGSRATAMGGTGVSSARPSLSGYYNPALLALAKSEGEVSLGAGFAGRENGVGNSYNDLKDSGFEETFNRLNNNPLAVRAEDLDVLIAGKNVVLDLDSKGIIINPDAYVGAQIEHFGIGVYAQTEGATAADVDSRYNRLIVGNESDGYYDVEHDYQQVSSAEYRYASMIYAIEAGINNIDVTGIILVEVPLSYGYALESEIGTFALGASLKLMQGTTYLDSIEFLSSDFQKDLATSETKSTTAGIDFGVVYLPSMVENLRVGLVGKNINAPAFKVYQANDYVLDPMLRLGVSYDIIEELEVALDSDLMSNSTSVPGFDIQYLGLGVNYHPIEYFDIGVGLMDNLASDLEGVIYTAGIGFGPAWLHFELAGQYASNESTVAGVTYPDYAKLNLAIVSSW